MKKLTIGMCTYDDFDGVFFTIQSIRLYHSEIIDSVEFIVVDNNPTSKSGEATGDYVRKIEGSQYIPFTDYTATTIKNKIFENARTPFVLCIDCHVLLKPKSIEKLIAYFEKEDTGNLLHGPLINEKGDVIATSMKDTWGSHMHGQWLVDTNYVDENTTPYDIFAMGMGLFACRKDSWLGFNPNFRGFGGEEVYLQTKYRAYNKRVILLPFLHWLHRFSRPQGVPYPNKYSDRYRNYIIGRMELWVPSGDVDDIFADILSEDEMNDIKIEAFKIFSEEDKIKNAQVSEVEVVAGKCGCRS